MCFTLTPITFSKAVKLAYDLWPLRIHTSIAHLCVVCYQELIYNILLHYYHITLEALVLPLHSSLLR